MKALDSFSGTVRELKEKLGVAKVVKYNQASLDAMMDSLGFKKVELRDNDDCYCDTEYFCSAHDDNSLDIWNNR